MSATKGNLLSRACFWSGSLIDSHCVANSVSRKWSTHMDSRIHRAFPRKRYKDNKLYWQTRTAKAHKRRVRSSPLFICFPSCSYRWSPGLLPSFYVYVLPPFCNQFSFSLCLLLSFQRVLSLRSLFSSLYLLPLFSNHFSFSLFMILFHSYRGFQGQYLCCFFFLFRASLCSV